ncbi:hypothetical protein ES703_40147 [subsurface metagenome]
MPGLTKPEIDNITAFWEGELSPLNRVLFEPSVIYFLEATIRALKELSKLKGVKNDQDH